MPLRALRPQPRKPRPAQRNAARARLRDEEHLLSALGDVFDVTEAEGRLELVPKTRELREFVKRATLEGTDFPTRFTLDYVTGDRLEIDLVQSR